MIIPSMGKLKIAIIGHLKYPLSEPFTGGLESFTHSLAAQLIKNEHEVTVFSARGTDPAINPYIMCDATEAGPHPLSQEEIKNIEFQAYSSIMDILNCSNFDIVHNNSLHYLPITKASSLTIPMLTTIHIPPEKDELESALKNASNTNNKLITISKFLQNQWSPIIDSEVIYNGIDLSNFMYNRDKEDYIVWFGRITKEKGTIYAVQAAQKLGFKLKIAGTIYDKAYYQNKIQPALGDNIEYLGPLKQQELQELIGKAKVSLCTPIWDEPYGLVLAEALACGTPIAAFAKGAIPELLNDKVGVLAQAEDSEDLVKAVQQAALLSPAQCRQRAYEIADINIMIDKYEKLYYHLIAAKN